MKELKVVVGLAFVALSRFNSICSSTQGELLATTVRTRGTLAAAPPRPLSYLPPATAAVAMHLSPPPLVNKHTAEANGGAAGVFCAVFGVWNKHLCRASSGE